MRTTFICLAALAIAGCSSTPSPPAFLGESKPVKAIFDPKAYDGEWAGLTAQKRKISFVVAGGKITKFSIAGHFKGGGCSGDNSSSTTFSEAEPLTGPELTIDTHVPNGVSTGLTGHFESTQMAKGKATLYFSQNIYGLPSCDTTTETTWEATRQPAKQEVVPKRKG